MTDAQRAWMSSNPEFSRIGPPRAVKFAEWGTLTAEGEYIRLDDKPRAAIKIGDGRIGVARKEQDDG